MQNRGIVTDDGSRLLAVDVTMMNTGWYKRQRLDDIHKEEKEWLQ